MTAYRASPHEATGYNPNYFVFDRELSTPIDAVLDPFKNKMGPWTMMRMFQS